MYALFIASTHAASLGERFASLPLAAETTGGSVSARGSEKIGASFADPRQVLDAALWGLRTPGSAVGLGVCPVTTADAPDIALSYARAAMERCTPHPGQGNATFRNIAVDGPDPALADAATGLARLIARLVGTRSEAEWRVVDLVVPGVRGQHGAIAEALGVSPQAVSKALIRTGWHEQAEGVAALTELLRRQAS
ncbi:recombinase RecJ [uncultured Kocuria sp.]|uniref:recombinase RecJ n=1 Tax=uncultured Kocuria sp. TaxID=259305 RepID=UPI002597C577|nr:recombinase RecJ [uncultured Kocuria sp.]MCT1367166.1 recombinase RecJ [Rothia sp. p3-SID1597]